MARAAEGRPAVAAVVEELTTYGDAGAQLPQLFLGLRARIVNLSGLISPEQVLSLAEAELAGLPPEEQVLVLGAKR